MKRFILIVISLVCMAYSASAQWQKANFPADELKGTEAYTAYIFYDSDSDFMCYWSNDVSIKIGAGRGIFDYSDHHVRVIIGFYEGDTLLEKETATFYVPDGDSDTAYTSSYGGGKQLAEKIINHLNTKGDVRFIAPKYSGSDFDLVVKKRTDANTTPFNTID